MNMMWPVAVIKMRSQLEALLVWSAASSRRLWQRLEAAFKKFFNCDSVAYQSCDKSQHSIPAESLVTANHHIPVGFSPACFVASHNNSEISITRTSRSPLMEL